MVIMCHSCTSEENIWCGNEERKLTADEIKCAAPESGHAKPVTDTFTAGRGKYTMSLENAHTRV